MTNKIIKLKLTIKFHSPFTIGSGFDIAGFVDSSTIKDGNNLIYIPASSIKGKIRSEFKKIIEGSNAGSVCNSIISNKTEICKHDINNSCVICRIFGSEMYEGSLIFEDAVMDTESREVLCRTENKRVIPVFQSSSRTGIRINRLLRTAEKGALFNIEGANPAITFTSNIYGSCHMMDEEYDYFKWTIENITHMGGNKARGMGRCKIKIEEL